MSTMPNQLEWYRRMKNENRSHWLWPRTLVMGKYQVLLTTENECGCGSCQYGLLFWMVKGERTLGSVLPGWPRWAHRLLLTAIQAGSSLCLDGYKLDKYRLREKYSPLVLPSLCLLVVPAILPLLASCTGLCSLNGDQGPGASLGWKVCQVQVWEVRECAMCSCSLSGSFLCPWKASPKYFRDETPSGN